MALLKSSAVLACGVSAEKCPEHIKPSAAPRLVRIKTPLFAPGSGTTSGVTAAELRAALMAGAKRLSFGAQQQEMARLLPASTTADVLVLAVECRMLHGQQMAGLLATALHHRAHLTDDVYPTLQLVLYELLTNAIEHGNLGLTETREKMVGRDGWYEGYLALVKERLESAVGTIPLLLVARRKGAELEITLEDRGMGFQLRDVLTRVRGAENPTGRGLRMVFSLLNNKVDFTDSGRKVVFSLPTRPRLDASLPNRSSIREQGRVMVVDDDAVNLRVAKSAFSKAGFTHLATVADSSKALEEAEKFEPDLIVLDVVMPDPDGFSLCAQLKAHPRLADVPVMFFSGVRDQANRTRGYQLGAVDFVSKPVDPVELVAHVETHLLNGMMVRALHKMSDKMSADLERAQAFQRELFPSAAMLTALAEQHGVGLAAVYQGCETLAGDYWTVLGLDETHLGVCLVDFTGHGVIAALNTVQLHTLFHRLDNLFDPVGVAKELNHHLHQLLDLGSFATFMYGVLNTETGDFSYAGCGAPPLFVLDSKGACVSLDCSGMPLGLGGSVSILPRRTKLEPESTLVMVSDALLDAPHANGTRWEQEGVARALSGLSGCGAQNLLNGLMDTFYTTVTLPVPDDLTAVALTYRPAKGCC